MYHDKRILALIPARGGSKGIKNKNIMDFCGKPLIAYTIEAAKNSLYADDIVVSTDSRLIAEVAREYGAEVPFLRPEELAADDSKTIDAVLHAISELKKSGREYDSLLLLQATQPLRSGQDIDGAIEKYYKSNEAGLVSVSLVEDNPILIRTVSEKDTLVPLLDIPGTCRRQEMPLYYKVNGCIYINKISTLSSETSLNDNSVPYIMPQERSVDIDEWKDVAVACYYLGSDNKGSLRGLF